MIAEIVIPAASGVGTATIEIRSSFTRRATRFRIVVSVSPSSRPISVLLARPSFCKSLMMSRSMPSSSGD